MQVILIGRGAQPISGQLIINSRSVSGQHAKAVIDVNKNTIVIEDLGSTNGTFVNGFRIKRKNISHSDVILIADQRINLQQILDAARSMREDPNDYSIEFGKLQNVWDNHQVLLKQARSSNSMDTFLTVCLIVAPALLLGPIAGAVVAGGAIGGTAVGSAVGLAARELFTKNKSAKTQNLVAEIENDFKIHYVCPKCSRSLYGFPYEYYKKQRQCVQCKAVWIKQ